MSVFLTDSGRWLQLMDGKASKECALLDIARDEVVVFGNDLPDRGMFETFGRSVVVANAPGALKEATTHVTRSNDEDGIAFALENHLGVL